MRKTGWFNEAKRHSLAAQGVKTGRKTKRKIIYSRVRTVERHLFDDFDTTFLPIEESIEVNETKDGYELKYLTYDPEPDDPRNWDNLGKMVCFHQRYTLGDKTDYNLNNYDSWEELAEAIKEEENPAIMLPLYLYDHSGLRMKVGSFQGLLPQGHAEFDSGQIGFIYVTKEDLKKEGLTTKKAKNILQGEVSTYDQYLIGDVYSIVKETYDKEKNQIDHDSVGSYFGYEYAENALETDI